MMIAEDNARGHECEQQQPRKKRVYVSAGGLPEPMTAFCVKCHRMMVANGTSTTSDGLSIQYRKCPNCGETRTTTYRRDFQHETAAG
jgi:hypothetical protein